ncbi:hypothetical protein BCR42DRAFT_404107 [Absidia repens]|uniref:PX domain-containing protein n=1 Tax=Absidia repens TaxID=90262 RepID=A0A1X2IVT2_9FUNG|nr:hypothetical protein BCR42DRAFT_404107 [Absidia repens]
MHLTPIQLHYLKKELINLELNREWAYLQETCPDLIYLSSIPQQQQQQQQQNPVILTTTEDLPFIRFIIHHLIQPFPLIQYQTEQQKTTFWSQWQFFLTEWYQRQPSTWMPSATQETLERRAMIVKVKKMVSLLLEKLIKCNVEEASYNPSMTSDDLTHQLDIGLTTSRPPPSPSPSPSARDDTNSTTETKTTAATANSTTMMMMMHGINIVSAQVLDTQDTRSHRRRFQRFLTNSTATQHTYFIIETKDNNVVHYVPRRHSDFRRLAKQLRSQFPERKDIPTVPAKIRAGNNSEDGLPWCEMDRRRLRAFLQQVASIPALRQSDLFQAFLLPAFPNKSPAKSDDDDDTDEDDSAYEKKTTMMMTALWNKDKHLDKNDVAIRQQLDEALHLDQQQYSQHIDDTLSSLDQELKQIKQLLFQPGGCTHLLNVIKTTENWQDLPNDIKKGFEWGQLCFAFTLHKQLVVSDLALENRNQLRKTHNYMPYRTLSTLMKIYNPMHMVKAMLNLFLARPFGGQSLMQRTILINLQEEMNSIQKDIKTLEKSIDPMICDKLYNAVTTKRTDAHDVLEGLSPVNALLFILKHVDIEPVFSASKFQHINFTDTPNNDNDSIHWKDVQRLWHLYAKREDHTKWMDILLQQVTGTLLQSVMEILYQPLAQVYQAADLGTTLYELKDFIDDLIHVMDDIQLDQQHQPLSSSLDTIQPFIDLVQRHQHAFYQFVHNVHTQTESKLFTDLISFVDTWLARTYEPPFSKDQCDTTSSSPSPPSPRWNIHAFWSEANLNKEQEQALAKELDVICEYHHARKVHMFEKRRRRMEKMVAVGQRNDAQSLDNEMIHGWSDVDEEESDLDDDMDESSNQPHLRNRIIPPTFPSSSVLSSFLLPTFVRQISPLLLFD